MKKLKSNFKTEGSNVEVEITSARDMSKYEFNNPGEAMEMAKKMGFDKVHTHKVGDKTVFMPGPSHDELMKKIKASCETEHMKSEDMKAGYYKVPAAEKEKHQKYMARCMANDKESVDTEGLDEDRAHMACAIAYDKEFKTAYAPCVPGAGCIY